MVSKLASGSLSVLLGGSKGVSAAYLVDIFVFFSFALLSVAAA